MRERWLIAVALVALVLAAAPASAEEPPPARYRWVEPPADQALVNIPPAGRSAVLPLTAGRLAATDVWTADVQAVLSLPSLDVGVAGDALTVSIEPRAAQSLAPLPAGVVANGNAYAVTLTAGDAVVGRLAAGGRLYLAVPQPATGVLYSADGDRWDTLALADGLPTHAVVSFAQSGFYVAVSSPARGGGSALPVGATAAGVAAAAVAAGLIVRRARRVVST